MAADNPANVKLKYKKFYQVRKLACNGVKEQMQFDMNTRFLGNVLLFGDTQPAIVQSVAPLTISAYSDEMDAVIFLRFPDELAQTYGLTKGARLVTATSYVEYRGNVASDIFPGPGFSRQYGDFIPVVQLFFGGKKQVFFAGGDNEIRERTSIFGEDTWKRVEQLTEEYAARNLFRDGVFYMKS